MNDRRGCSWYLIGPSIAIRLKAGRGSPGKPREVFV